MERDRFIDGLRALALHGAVVGRRLRPAVGCVMRQGAHGGWDGPLWPSLAGMWEETSNVLLGIPAETRPQLVQTSVGEWWFPGGWWPDLAVDHTAPSVVFTDPVAGAGSTGPDRLPVCESK